MKNLNKKALILCILITLIATAAACGNISNDDSPSINTSEVILVPGDVVSDPSVSPDASYSSSVQASSENSFEVSEETSSDTSSVSTSSVAPPQTYDGDWKLILVNSENLLPADFSIKTANIGSRPMDERIIDIVKQMIADAKSDGVDLLICSSYRSVERQTTLFNEQISKFTNQGYSYDDARTEASKWVAVPGTSEHHTGLALDIVTPTYQVLDFGFEETEAFKWLYSHCTEYGFILRYPKDKTDITGIVYEPWHYRYVGVEVAKYIHANGLCFEEYIQLQ